MMEPRSRSSERMRLELDNTWLYIVSLRPAGLLVDELRRVVAIQVVSRVAFAGRILALVLIAHTSATGHLAIAFALSLTTWVGVSGWRCLVGLNRSKQAEDWTHMGRKQPCCADGPGGRPQAWRSAIFWRHCRWAFSGMLRPVEEFVVNFLRFRSAALGHGRVLAPSGAGWGPPVLG